MNNLLSVDTLLFAYVLDEIKVKAQKHTLERYLYLYYIASKYLTGEEKEATFFTSPGSVRIFEYGNSLDKLQIDRLIDVSEDIIQISSNGRNHIEKFLNPNDSGDMYDKYQQIKPLLTLLTSYDDDFIFTVSFSEPTYNEFQDRGMPEYTVSESRLSVLLAEFEKSISNNTIDKYDILANWVAYILDSFYEGDQA